MNAVVRPAIVHAKAHVPSVDIVQENTQFRRASVTAVISAVATTSTGVKTNNRTAMMGLPITERLVINKGTDGQLHEIELTENGNTTSFVGDTEKQGIVKVMMHLLKPRDIPNN